MQLDSSTVLPAGRLHQIADGFVKRTFVLSAEAVERYSSTGIPAYGLAIVVILGTVLVFLLCWCIAYGMCMCWAVREATSRTSGTISLDGGSRQPYNRSMLVACQIQGYRPLSYLSPTPMAEGTAGRVSHYPHLNHLIRLSTVRNIGGRCTYIYVSRVIDC